MGSGERVTAWWQQHKRWFDLDALLIRIAGLVALLSIPFKHFPYHVGGLLPIQLEATSHVLSFCLGLSLLYIANQITLRKLNAWYVSVAALGCLIIAELLHFRNPLQVVLYLITLLSITKDRSQFVVRSDAESLRRGLTVAAVMLVSILLFAGIVFELIDQRAFGRDLSTGQTLSVTWHVVTGGDLLSNAHLRRYDIMLLGLLRISAVAAVAIVGYSLFRPLQLRRKAPPGHVIDAQALLRRYSDSSEDFFKLWPQDKHYFFYGDAFVAYGISGNVALVLDGVSGDPAQLPELRKQFDEYARLNGWTVSVVHADTHESEAWTGQGYERLFIGSEAVVDCAAFVASTTRNKHFRYVNNKAIKEGLKYELWQPPLSKKQIASLRSVSDAWLANNRREYTFIMGYFDDAYIGSCQVAVLTRDGEPVAYANLIPTYRPELASIDHMRFMPGVSSVAMHYLLRETIVRVHETGVVSFNLGLVPLSKLHEQMDKSLSERLLETVKTLGSRYYSFSGLEQFKGKFEPEWEPRYIVYKGSPTRLLTVAAALNSASAYRPVGRDRVRGVLVGLAVLSGLAYGSFPLAYWLNRPYFWQGTVSNLGRDDQPYAWLFNSLDIVSTILGFIILAVIAHRYWPRRKSMRAAVLLAFLSLCGTIAAAAITLPFGFRDDDFSLSQLLQPAVIFHGLTSFINSGGFVVSAILLAWPYRKKWRDWRNWRLWLAVISLLLGTVGALVGALYEPSTPTLQRLFIFCYVAWVIELAYDGSARRAKLFGKRQAQHKRHM